MRAGGCEHACRFGALLAAAAAASALHAAPPCLRGAPLAPRRIAAPPARHAPPALAVRRFVADFADRLAQRPRSSLPPPRPPYQLTNYTRPAWRGTAMGWAHRTRVWYALSLVYITLAASSSTLAGFAPVQGWMPLDGRGVALRVAAAAASSANILVSDGYHNSDRRDRAVALTPAAELRWLRWDYVGISSVLTTLLWLWSSNFGWIGRLRAVGIASGVATGLVALFSRVLVPRKVGHATVKLVMASQFVGLLGYLIFLAVTAAPRACARNSIIFWIYFPGLLCYVLKRPADESFGFHEFFHASVLTGHLVSMACDLRDIAAPCARCLL